MDIQKVNISKLHSNKGQLLERGLPKNPRLIKDDKFKKLCNSLKEHPFMLTLREVIAYDNQGELIVICGNMRLKAAKELKLKELPCKILPYDTSIEDLKAYAILDNSEFGEYDFNVLKQEWGLEPLDKWGVEFPAFSEGDMGTAIPQDMIPQEDYEDDLEEPTNLDGDREEKSFVVKVTFKDPSQVNDFMAQYKESIEEQYDCIMSVSGGML